MSYPILLRKEIEDQYIQENFKRIMDYGAQNPLDRANFKFFSIEFLKAETNFKYKHNLGFTPLDVIIMHNSNNVNVTLNYSSFDSNDLNITVSGATTLRCLVGRYQ